MPAQENRAIFDRRKNELTVITYYDEKTFKKQCVEKILAYKLNTSLREGLLFRDMSRLRGYFSFLAVCSGVLCVGELAVRDFSMRMLPYFIATLFLSIFIYQCTSWIIWALSVLHFRYNWVCDRGKNEYIRAAKRLKSSPTSTRNSIILPNGGNNCTVKAKARTVKVFSRLPSI